MSRSNGTDPTADGSPAGGSQAGQPQTGGGISPPSTESYVPPVDDPAGAPSPEEVLELAAAAVRFVATNLKIQPDFTPETLPLVDHYLADAAKELQVRPETLPITAHSIGAYLGEVVRKRHPCWWRLDPTDPATWRLEFGRVHVCFYPVQVVYATLTRNSNEETFAGFEVENEHHDAVMERLELIPPVSEDDYYALGTRVEVLDIVIDAVAARVLSDPGAKRLLGPDDY